ncbi:hypothetical protein HY745_09840 [Candidatus Desantisbacteria bacterium]|nr:hypothetical protein [Candidatus Desantisbacteria bacterium]
MKECFSGIEEFGTNVYSQSGEDGVIQKILEIIPDPDKWCVEFGAWDGRHLSNTRNLIEKKNYNAIFIEGDKKRFDVLRMNYSQNKNVFAFNEFVGFSKDKNLDNILEKTKIPVNFDLLSIDIDGNDYYTWEAMSRYKPKLVCIEYNPTIPNEVRFVQKPDITVNQGSSLLSLFELGKSKGYELIVALRNNAFFISSEYFPLFQIKDNRPEVLRKDMSNITYLFSGYDGKIILQGGMHLPCHDLKLTNNQFQVLPGFLRKYPGNYNKIESIMYKLFITYRRLITKLISAFSRSE